MPMCVKCGNRTVNKNSVFCSVNGIDISGNKIVPCPGFVDKIEIENKCENCSYYMYIGDIKKCLRKTSLSDAHNCTHHMKKTMNWIQKRLAAI